MKNQSISVSILLLWFSFLNSCSLKEKHPLILGNIVLNQKFDYKNPDFYTLFSEVFYVYQSEVEGNISETVLADPSLQIADTEFHGRKISSNCFKKFSRVNFFNSFTDLPNHTYIDSNLLPVTEEKLLGGIFYTFRIEEILYAVELELCTYERTYSSCPCPNIIIDGQFSSQVRNAFESQMFKKYGKPTEITFIGPEYSEKVTKIGEPIFIVDTSYYLDVILKENRAVTIVYEWQRNGYRITLSFKRNGPYFSNNISDPEFKKFESDGNFTSSLIKYRNSHPSSFTSRIDFRTGKVISIESYSGFIRYSLDKDIQDEIEEKLNKEEEQKIQEWKERREVY